jgi:UDP-N-acetylglucosamine/UDP-N-acetyl-alpha-D-glucosaminouronate 4-epimerase
MKYLVTGGAGFIGSHLVAHLVADGHAVSVLDDFSTGRPENLAPVRERIELLEGSVTDPKLCRRAARGAECILHQAAFTSVARSINEPLAAHAANVTGTVNVLVAAREMGARRVVFAGSTAVYGDQAALPNSESMLPRPLSPYAATKLAGEDYCQAFYASLALETVVLRYFNVFGPRQDPTSEYAAVIPKFVLAALRLEPPTIYGDGQQTRDFTFVGDVVHANLLAARAPGGRVAGRVFNVGTGRQVSINALWDQIQDLVGVRLPALHVPARPGEVRDSCASIERAKDHLGYEPRVELDEALRRTVAFYRERLDAGDRGAATRRTRSRTLKAREA